jgi:hypothetical protein
LQLCKLNTHWTCSCDVDMITEVAEGWHMHVSQALKNFHSFSFWWHKPDTCMAISSQDWFFFYFGYLSSEHPVF